MVLSIIAYWLLPSAARCSKTCSHTPVLAQRLNRRCVFFQSPKRSGRSPMVCSHGTSTAPPRQTDDCHGRLHRRRSACREAGPQSVPTGRREVHSGSWVSLLQIRLYMIHINFCLGRLFYCLSFRLGLVLRVTFQ